MEAIAAPVLAPRDIPELLTWDEIRPDYDLACLNLGNLLARLGQFDEAVRPGLASDGGGLHLVDVDGKAVRVQYQGACGSCPSSTSGTLYYIESVLRSRVHPDLEVELV